MTGFLKRDHLGLRSDFELGIWSERSLDELPVTFYCASLASFRYAGLNGGITSHNIKETAFESLLLVKLTKFCILPCY